MANIPNPLDSILLSEKMQKIEVFRDKKIFNSAIFKIQKEDHTLGNLIQKQILKNPNVLVCGYKLVHPLEHFIILKIITNGLVPPVKVIDLALKDLYIKFSLLDDSI